MHLTSQEWQLQTRSHYFDQKFFLGHGLCTFLLFNVLISLTICSDCFWQKVLLLCWLQALATLQTLRLLTLLTNTCSDLIAVASLVIITWNTCYAREKWTSNSRTTLWKGCGKQANGKSVNNLENDFIPVADVVKYLQWTLDNRHITFTIPKAALLKS